MESCEDDTEVESVDGSTISSSSGSDTVLEDNPPDDNSNFSSTLANLGSEDDLKYISADSDRCGIDQIANFNHCSDSCHS